MTGYHHYRDQGSSTSIELLGLLQVRRVITTKAAKEPKNIPNILSQARTSLEPELSRVEVDLSSVEMKSRVLLVMSLCPDAIPVKIFPGSLTTSHQKIFRDSFGNSLSQVYQQTWAHSLNYIFQSDYFLRVSWSQTGYISRRFDIRCNHHNVEHRSLTFS